MVKRPETRKARDARHARVRKKISGTPECPRLSVFRSLQHIYAQLIDDVNGVTLAAAASNEKDFGISGGNKEGARKVGQLIAKRAAEKGIEEVVFDRLYWDRLDLGTITDEETVSLCRKRLPERLWDDAEKIHMNWIYNLNIFKLFYNFFNCSKNIIHRLTKILSTMCSK